MYYFIVRWGIIAFLLSLTFDGALRYYLSISGLSIFIYAPKIWATLAIVLVVSTAVMRGRLNAFSFSLALVLLSALAVGLLQVQGGARQVGFGLFLLVPFGLGLVALDDFAKAPTFYARWLSAIVIASAIGVYVDYYIDMPWSGASFEVFDTQVETSRRWYSWGFERVAGLTRSSSSVAGVMTTASLFALCVLKSTKFRIFLFLFTAGAIGLTTAKAIIAGYVLALGLLVLPYRFFSGMRLAAVVALGVLGALLPATGWFLNTGRITVQKGSDLFYTLAARIANTWPEIWDMLIEHGNWFLGRGVGGLGVSQRVFESSIWVPPDNMYLFIYGTFGIPGLLICAALIPAVLRWRGANTPINNAIVAMTLAISVSGVTDKVLQSGFIGFFAGLVVASFTAREVLAARRDQHATASVTDPADASTAQTPAQPANTSDTKYDERGGLRIRPSGYRLPILAPPSGSTATS